MIKTTKPCLLNCLAIAVLAMLMASNSAQAWWNPEWTVRKKITVDTTPAGASMTDAIGATEVLIRLHSGNFQFTAAKDDASDLRAVAADDKTLLPFHIERYEGIMEEGFVWVRVPEVKPGEKVSFWLYYGNGGDSAARVENPKGTYDADTVLVYHFSEKGTAPIDITTTGNSAEKPGTPVPGALIGGGLRFGGQNPLSVPANPTLLWAAGAPMTWSAWVKPTALAPDAIVFNRKENGNSFVVGINNGIPYVEVKDATGTQRTPNAPPIEAGGWHHLAVVAANAQMTLFLDGDSYGTLAAAIPALNSPLSIGGEPVPEGADASSVPPGFVGELDELKISKVARPPGVLKFAALNQGTSEKAAKCLAVGDDEQSEHGSEGELTKHITLLTDISKSLTPDGWAVIFLCTLLAIAGGVVAAMKFIYLNKIDKATRAFLAEWKHCSADFAALDHSDEQSIKSMGGKVGNKAQKLMGQSPLYHIFQIGSSEIQHRVVKAREGFKGLSERSMHAIRVTLDGGLVRETQRLNSNLVFLTIGIAGGPYLGLLGTVIGVMITFAVIAKSGAVEVNSIAPGIAGALLATVAGLAVAIPCLFAYSYISSRIKDAVAEMQVFIDEFVAKIAESFPDVED